MRSNIKQKNTVVSTWGQEIWGQKNIRYFCSIRTRSQNPVRHQNNHAIRHYSRDYRRKWKNGYVGSKACCRKIPPDPSQKYQQATPEKMTQAFPFRMAQSEWNNHMNTAAKSHTDNLAIPKDSCKPLCDGFQTCMAMQIAHMIFLAHLPHPHFRIS